MPKVVQEHCRGSVCVDACLIGSGVDVGALPDAEVVVSVQEVAGGVKVGD